VVYVRLRFGEACHRSVLRVNLKASGVNGLPFEVLINCHAGRWDLWLSCISLVHLKTDSVDPENLYGTHLQEILVFIHAVLKLYGFLFSFFS